MKTQVTIISIWSKLNQNSEPVSYTVEVPQQDAIENTLEEALILTNRDDRPKRQQVCSTTPGDILIVANTPYLVECSGFTKLTETESAHIQTLSSRDTTFGYDYLKSKNLL